MPVEKAKTPLPIVTYPTPTLNERSFEVALSRIKQREFQKFIDELIETMIIADGVGIAAPQTGHNIRVAILARPEEPHEVIINPVIISRSLRSETMEEGCLSLPGVFGMVKRARALRFKAYDRRGKLFERNAKGLDARVVQHEVDHLDGTLFIKRATRITADTQELLPKKKI